MVLSFANISVHAITGAMLDEASPTCFTCDRAPAPSANWFRELGAQGDRSVK